MIIKPKILGPICASAHPVGCNYYVREQIGYVKQQTPMQNGPKNVLVIGASMGYGLASRIVCAFGAGASTVGVFWEKPAEGKRTATAGWYHSKAFDLEAIQAGLYARSINGDAFSHEIKRETVDIIKKELGPLDLVVYSLAASKRVYQDGKVSKTILKTIGNACTIKSINLKKDTVFDLTIEQATSEDINQTIDVMGGGDWQEWIELLEQNNLLAPQVLTVAYSYIGPDITKPVYRHGTLGAAKEHLEKTAKRLNERLQNRRGRALVSVNKALVTQSSAVIPFVPLYMMLLNKVLKEKGINEGCVEQIYRLFAEYLYENGRGSIDREGRIRMDNFEMQQDVQNEILELWKKVNSENLSRLADVRGYKEDFLRMFGFGFKQVNYSLDVAP